MAGPDLARPAPSAITTISPTGANTLLRCGLRAAFSRDPSFAGWQRRSTYAVIGEAAHRVSEVSHRRATWSDDPATLREELDVVWDGAIEAGRLGLVAAWEPACPPPPMQWPGYQLTRTRTIRRAMREIAARADVPPSGVIAGTGIERTLVDPDSILRGRADRVDAIGAHVRVVDLKTGLYQSAPTDDQRRQLLLYAVLVQRTSGAWPAELAIENAAGESIGVAFAPAEAETALHDTLVAVGRFNDRVAAGADPFTLAQPDPETCRYCPFRTCCGPYWRHLRTEWQHRAVRGTVREVGLAANGWFSSIEVTEPVDAPLKEVHVDRIAREIPTSASWLAAVDVSAGAERPSVHANWWSRIETW